MTSVLWLPKLGSRSLGLRELTCLGELVFQVVRAAEEAASTLASSIHPEQCIKVLCPIIQTADYPINLAAIKMQTKVVERIAKESLLQLLADIIPGLLQVGPLGGWPVPVVRGCEAGSRCCPTWVPGALPPSLT